jgi:amino-acid N-acetyltransferase
MQTRRPGAADGLHTSGPDVGYFASVAKKRFDTEGFRRAAPYINAHRGRRFVLAFGGEAVADERFSSLTHDIALLHSLGVRLVLVHGARPQIEARLRPGKGPIRFHQGRRVTDDTALAAVKEAVGCVRVEIEARLSMGLVNTPMSGMNLTVSSGNYVTARPLGVREGIDFRHTGEVRKVDAQAIVRQLDLGHIVLLSALGYSPTGETFNVSAPEVATATAAALAADKLILLAEGGLGAGASQPPRQMTLEEAQALLEGKRRLDPQLRRQLEVATRACRGGVARVHLLQRHDEDALLKELFTRDGAGTLISAETYEGVREAGIDDVGGILVLIAPLERSGVLVPRSREQLELEIDRFRVIGRDGMIIACAALYPFPKEAVGELACLAVHPDYRSGGRGDTLLQQIEAQATALGLKRLLVLTTHTAHWFVERGFVQGDLATLPVRRRDLYNYQRNAKVFFKDLEQPS